MAKPSPNSSPGAIRVWDLPTRLFHWGLAGLVLCSVVSAKIGGGAMVWHVRFGYCIAALLIFRLAWGLLGGHWSRFASFIYGPASVVRYLRGQSRPEDRHEVGHSPLGAASVFALLAWLCIQVGTGLVSDDEISFLGPLNRWVSPDTGIAATGWHKHWGEIGLGVLVGLHVAAILYYVLVKKKALIRPMLDGDKSDLPGDTPASADGLRQRGLAAVLLLVAAAAVAAVVLKAP
ncbi:MAG: cytochrome b/b6 domain-containing protein [Rubrivivax sp.]|jgi:cytochrome b|nr:cytochrome b/b6 domain-containing protein [Rubrivivax sp.]